MSWSSNRQQIVPCSPSYRYETLDTLLAALADYVIAPAEQRANEIASKK